MRLPTVSIIIPVYNVEKYLKESLESAVSQTLDNYEIIIIDDGSTDNSLKIIKDFNEKYSNIRFIVQENQGQGVARNKGLEVAKGKYIYFLDSDDYIDINTLKIAYEESEKNNLDLLLFNGETFYDEDYDTSNNLNINYKKKGEYTSVSTGAKTFIQLIKNKDYTCSPCLLFIKKEVLEENNLNFHEGIIQEDELFTFKLILMCKRVKVINDILFYRRVRASSTMSGKNYHSSFIGYYTVLKEMINFKSTLGINTQDLEEATEKKISYIYGSSLNRYILLDAKKKKKVSEYISEIKDIGAKHHYFYRTEYRLFNYSEQVYSILRRMYEKLSNPR